MRLRRGTGIARMPSLCHKRWHLSSYIINGNALNRRNGPKEIAKRTRGSVSRRGRCCMRSFTAVRCAPPYAPRKSPRNRRERPVHTYHPSSLAVSSCFLLGTTPLNRCLPPAARASYQTEGRNHSLRWHTTFKHLRSLEDPAGSTRRVTILQRRLGTRSAKR